MDRLGRSGDNCSPEITTAAAAAAAAAVAAATTAARPAFIGARMTFSCTTASTSCVPSTTSAVDGGVLREQPAVVFNVPTRRRLSFFAFARCPLALPATIGLVPSKTSPSDDSFSSPPPSKENEFEQSTSVVSPHPPCVPGAAGPSNSNASTTRCLVTPRPMATGCTASCTCATSPTTHPVLARPWPTGAADIRRPRTTALFAPKPPARDAGTASGTCAVASPTAPARSTTIAAAIHELAPRAAAFGTAAAQGVRGPSAQTPVPGGIIPWRANAAWTRSSVSTSIAATPADTRYPMRPNNAAQLACSAKRISFMPTVATYKFPLGTAARKCSPPPTSTMCPSSRNTSPTHTSAGGPYTATSNE
mmetsp:Transcript_31187/g.93036  ORF Transcript_31187/g.93036 Transcript_31187/m.93036 type:complete len:363 (+) Transcript_31187:4762-5850(+)